MNKVLTNKTCIIVGASGEIGLNCSQLFYDQGARLILIYNKNFKVIKNFNKDKKIFILLNVIYLKKKR